MPLDCRREYLTIVERMLDSVDLLATLVAFACDEHDVAGARPCNGCVDRSGPVADLPDLATPVLSERVGASSTAARIEAGSSVRGLSSVTTRSSAEAATDPMSGRLPRSRSPPAPTTTAMRPDMLRRRVEMTASSAAGLWA